MHAHADERSSPQVCVEALRVPDAAPVRRSHVGNHVPLVKVADIDVGSHFKDVRHRLTGEHHMAEDRQRVFLVEGSDTELAPEFVVWREPDPVAMQVSIHGRIVHHNRPLMPLIGTADVRAGLAIPQMAAGGYFASAHKRDQIPDSTI